MRPWEFVIVGSQVFLIAAGWVRRIAPRQQREVVGLGVLGGAFIAASELMARHFPVAGRVVRDWLPCVLMMIVYWQAGRFFGERNEKLQALLADFDRRRLGKLLHRWCEWDPSWIGGYFELAYLLCYLLIPAGVGVLYAAHKRSAIDAYWATVLSASCLCYVCVPFFQTLPPRLLPASRAERPGRKDIRTFNLYILRQFSIHLNTFPSAHVASAMAASLVVLGQAPAAGLAMMLVTLSIAAGAVLGRYHYALDVLLGAVLSIFIVASYLA